MLYELLYPLRDWFSGFNLFRYISFRAALAALFSFFFCLYFGPKIIAWLRGLKLQERPDKTDSPELKKIWQDSGKEQTPTMGGVLLACSALGSVLLWCRLSNVYVLLAIALYLGFAVVGFVDDLIKLRHATHGGLSRKAKMLWLSAIGLLVLFALYVRWQSNEQMDQFRLYFPFFKKVFLDLPSWGWGGIIFFFAFEWFVLVGCSNAVNISDGIDGLAAGCSLMVFFALAVLCYVVGRVDFTKYLQLPYIPGCGELAVFAAALAGACLGFLWFNCYPAQVFMGDTGSLPLGGSIAFLAIVAKQEFVLPVVGGIFFIEVLSSYIQIFAYKRWKWRPFRIAPFHHIFQLDKMPETKIVVRFWIVGALLALASIAALKLR